MALQTKTYSIGDFAKGSWSNGYVLDLILTEQSVANQENTSLVDYVLQLRSGNYNRFSDYLNCALKLNGASVAQKTVGIDAYYNHTYTLLSGSTTVKHNTDGSLNMAIEATIVEPDGNNQYAPPAMTISEIMTLTQIPRASTVSAADANIGAVAMIAIARKASAYTHSIAYEFGSLGGYITEDGDTTDSEVKFTAASVGFKVPTSFYEQIPDAKSGVCTLTVRTYSGSTPVGEAQTATFTATAAQAACAPAVSGTVVDSNETTKALTGDETKLVRYCSTALGTISATAKNSATISQKKIGGVEVSEDTRSIAEVATDSIVFYAKDSRGYETSATVAYELVPYVKLTSNPTGKRTDPTSGNATLTLKGDFYNGSFGAADNALTVKYRVGSGSYVTVKPTIDGNKYSASVAVSGLNYEQEFSIEVVVSDKITSVTKYVPIRRGIPIFDWGRNDFAFHVPMSMDGKRIMSVAAPTALTDAVNRQFLENGFVPKGYGLGEALGMKCSDCDEATTIGFYYLAGSGTLNIPSGYSSFAYGVLLVERRNGAVWHTIRHDNIVAMRMSIRDESAINNIIGWNEWEYANPPMALGVEYRTIKRSQGKAVYTKMVNFGTLPNATTKKVSVGTGLSMVSISGVASNGSLAQPLNAMAGVSEIGYSPSDGNLSVTTTANKSAYTSTWIILEYTK